MEWVETTGRSIEEAKDRALDQLGVAEDDAEFEVIDEPRAGLFGRVRGEARVRARVRPTQARPKVERRERRKRGDQPKSADSPEVSVTTEVTEVRPVRTPSPRGRKAAASVAPVVADAVASAPADEAEAESGPRQTPRAKPARVRRETSNSSNRPTADEEKVEIDVDAQQVGDEAQRFMRGLVDAFGLQGMTSLRRDGDDLEVVVEGDDLGLLVGPRGTTLQAVQELARVAAQRRLGDHDTRLRVDVAGYRERRREALSRFALQMAEAVVAEGKARALEPMSSSDRKVIHDVLSEVDGVVTRSEGDDPARRVVIAPAND